MIVYGWGNFNRRKHSVVRGTCQSCGRSGYLSSYTSTKFFTLYFIPVIPLGTTKIIQECPHCKQAFGLSARKWARLRKTELPAALAAYEATPSSAEAAKKLLAVCEQLHDRETLRRVGPQIQATFRSDPEVLVELAGAYSFLCLDSQADAVFLEAVALEPSGRVADIANAHLELQKLEKPTPPNRLLQSLPVVIVPAILLFFVVGFLQDALTSDLKHGYLLNGLDRQYTVRVNGESVTLRPHKAVRTRALRFGSNEIAPVDATTGPATQTVAIDVSWIDRAFSQPTFLINPDRAAVIAWERTRYTSGNQPEVDNDVELSIGKVLNVYEDIDYMFAEFPAQISTSSSSKVHYRTRLSDLGGMEIAPLYNVLSSYGKPGDLQAYLRARIAAGAESTPIVHLGSRFLPRDEFLGLAESRLMMRPVQLEWHRAYQTLVEGTPLGGDLEARYRKFADDEPANSTLLYLLGRVIVDPAESLPVLERAARMETPSAYAANGVAYHHLVEGHFEEAARWTTLALQLEPKNDAFKSLRLSALYGLGDFARAEQEAGDPLAGSELRPAECFAHLYRLGKLGQAKTAEAEILRYLRLAREKGQMSEADQRSTRAYLETAVALGTGDRVRFELASAKMSGPIHAMRRALVVGDLDLALKHAAEYGSGVPASDRLVLFTLLARAGRADAAAVQLESAVASLKAGTGDEQRWAQWLVSGEAPEADLVLHVCPELDEHPVYLTALAQRCPDRAAELLAQAEKIRWLDTYATLALAPR